MKVTGSFRKNLRVVGVGATGSNLVALLSQLAVSKKEIEEIILIDGDKVEEKNFKNQKFTMKDIDKNKAEVLANRYEKLGIKISYIDKYIESDIEIIELLKSVSEYTMPILIGCVDNNKCRRILNDAFEKYKDTLIYIDAGNGDIERKGQVVLGYKRIDQIISEPVVKYYPNILEDEEDEVNKYKCSRIDEHPQQFVTNVLSATSIFLMINALLEGEVPSTYISFNVENFSIRGMN